MKPFAPVALRVFNYFMSFIYILTGAFLIFSEAYFLSINKTGKTIVGVLLLAYGIFRIYRIFNLNRSQNES